MRASDLSLVRFVRGELDAPARQIPHGRLADQARKALGERRAGEADLTAEVIDAPLPADMFVQQGERARHERVFKSCEASGLFLRKAFDVMAHGLDEEQFG